MDFNELAQMFAASEEQKRQARMAALAQMGFGLMAAPRGREMQAFGRAAMGAGQTYHEAIGNARRDNAQAYMLAAKMQQEQEAAAREKAKADAEAADLARVNAAKADPFDGSLFAATGQMPRSTEAERLRRMAMATQNPTHAKIYGELADKAQEKFGAATVGMQGDRPVYMQAGDQGTTRVVPGLAPPPDTDVVDLGGRKLVRDKRAPAGATYGVTMTPAQTAADEVARGQLDVSRGNLAVNRGQLALQQQAAKEGGKAPAGYRWKADGTLEAIPGGPSDKGLSETARRDAAIARADLVVGKVDEMIQAVSNESMLSPRTGLTGSVAGKVPGTAAYGLRAAADTVKANIGFQELQAMREASPTGGALGQVAVQELNMLQAVIANIDPNQDSETLARNLTQVRKHMQNWRAVMQRAKTGGAGGATGGWSITEVK